MSYTVSYEYASGDLLENRNTYFYTKFHGSEFLTAWRNQRETALVKNCDVRSDKVSPDNSPIEQIIETMRRDLSGNTTSSATFQSLNRLVQRFEVTKRLHGEYNANWRPTNPQDYRGLERYVCFAAVLDLAYALTSALPYLNALLKIMDTLSAMHGQLNASQRIRMRDLAVRERRHVEQLVLKLGKQVAKEDGNVKQKATLTVNTPAGKQVSTQLRGVVLLAAQTARSQAYIQVLVANGLYPEKVIILGEEPSFEMQNNQLDSWQGIVLPNLTESVTQTCERAGIPISRCFSTDVNAEETVRCILDAAPQVIIYSGVGGQIVSDRTLESGPRFLHIHSGWLPEYRGSTTLYYALLEGESPGVTALFLDRTIDTGPVAAKRHYPKPPFDMDLDRVYDAAIRADLLVQAMRDYVSAGEFPLLTHQNPDEAVTYYVIHPVLKHLAILSLKKDEA